MKTTHYRQCTLRSGNTTLITHLAAQDVKIGRIVTLEDEAGEWTILGCGEPVEAQYAEAKAHAFTRIWNPSTALTARGKK